MTDKKMREALILVANLAANVAKMEKDWEAIQAVRDMAIEEFDDDDDDDFNPDRERFDPRR